MKTKRSGWKPATEAELVALGELGEKCRADARAADRRGEVRYYVADTNEMLRNESVAAARETDRRLKARSRGRMNRILDITYQAIRRRPEIFMGLLLLMLTGCAHRPRPHVSWPTELPQSEDSPRWVCKQDDPHNTGKDCVKRAFHYRVKR